MWNCGWRIFDRLFATMTRSVARILGLGLIFLWFAVPAKAQDDPRFAIVTSFPAPTVSFQWEASEKFALRVDGSYSYRVESERTSSGAEPPRVTPVGTVITIPTETHSEITSHTGSIGLAGIFTFYRTDLSRLYVAPRIAVSVSHLRLTSTVTRTLPPGVPPGLIDFPDLGPYESSFTSPGAGASFGAATTIHRRLALFGEGGFYTRAATSRSSAAGSSPRSTVLPPQQRAAMSIVRPPFTHALSAA